MRTKAHNPEVLYPDEPIVEVNRDDVDMLRTGANQSPKGRMRLCAHDAVGNALHEMIVVLKKDSYVRPHRHLTKCESFHVVEGRADVLIFDENGSIERVIEMGDYASGKSFFYRLPPMRYHTLRIHSPAFAFHETTNGPFIPGDAEFAPWSPTIEDTAGAAAYMQKLESATAPNAYPMPTRMLGKNGVQVSILGYGSQSLSLRGKPPEADAIDLLNRVLDAGVTFIDTADTYCLGPSELHHNERMIARVLASRGEGFGELIVATKGSTVRIEGGWEIDGTPERLYRTIRESHEALGGREPIPLWQLHWPDPRYSMPEMLGAAKRAQDEKLIRFVGIGNCTLDQLKEACDVIEITSVQNQYNLWHRDPEHNGMFEYCERNEIAFLPWRPMGGQGLAQRLGEIKPLAAIARERGISVHRLMIAWHLAKSPCILPIPGSSKLANVLDCLAAAHTRLDARELAVIDALGPADLPPLDRPPKTLRVAGSAS